jgi:hypothetical protein
MLIYRKPCTGPEPATFNIYAGNTAHSPSELFSNRLHQVLRLLMLTGLKEINSSLIHQNVKNLLCLLNGKNQISPPSVLMNHKLNELTNDRFLV